jgi:acetylornithine deacetylase
MERRTVPGESGELAGAEVAAILDRLRGEDPGFAADMRVTFSRPPYELPPGHRLPGLLGAVVTGLGARPASVGMSFWTDAAVLGESGIPTVLFGPGGAGLHGREEYVIVSDVLLCRDALATLARRMG